jgi:hypothetical protein
MLALVDKLSVWLAVAILGYLAYTTTERSGFSLETGKELPTITKKMLKPELIVPKDHTSPVGRDPFEVDWSTYFDVSAVGAKGQEKPEEGGQTSEPRATDPKRTPALPIRLMGILMAGNGQSAALIDGKVYQVGSLIDGADPETCWTIQAIRKSEVVLRFGTVSKTLMISRRPAATPAQVSETSKEAER